MPHVRKFTRYIPLAQLPVPQMIFIPTILIISKNQANLDMSYSFDSLHPVEAITRET